MKIDIVILSWKGYFLQNFFTCTVEMYFGGDEIENIISTPYAQFENIRFDLFEFIGNIEQGTLKVGDDYCMVDGVKVTLGGEAYI